MTEPTNGLAPQNEAGKFDEHVAVTIRTAVDEWRVHSDPAETHGVSMPEYIRRALADAGLLADRAEAETTELSRALWRTSYRALKDQHDGLVAMLRSEQASRQDWAAEALRLEAVLDQHRDLLGSIWLYVSWEYVTRQLTTDQKEMWAGAIEARVDLDAPEVTAQRWWRDDFKGANGA